METIVKQGPRRTIRQRYQKKAVQAMQVNKWLFERSSHEKGQSEV